MRADGVVDLFPVAEFTVECFHLQGAGRDLVRLFGVGAIGAFDRAVELGGARRKDEEMETALLTGLFELGSELGTASICTARMGKGMRFCKVSRNSVAV